MKPTLVILAAGMGSRYGGLKQLDQIGPSGETIIDYSVFDAIRAGFGKIIFIIRKDIEEAFKNQLGNRYAKLISVEYAYQNIDDLPDKFSCPKERIKPWGTGQAVLAAADIVKEPFAVINADDFYGRNAFRKTADYLKKTEDSQTTANYCMCGFDLGKTLSDFGSVSRGLCSIDSNNELSDVKELIKIEKTAEGIINTEKNGETTKLTGNEVVSMNMWGFTPSIFSHLTCMFEEFLLKRGKELKSEFFLPFAVDQLIKEKKAIVKVLNSHDNWFGVTYQEDKPIVIENVSKLISANVYPEKLF